MEDLDVKLDPFQDPNNKKRIDQNGGWSVIIPHSVLFLEDKPRGVKKYKQKNGERVQPCEIHANDGTTPLTSTNNLFGVSLNCIFFSFSMNNFWRALQVIRSSLELPRRPHVFLSLRVATFQIPRAARLPLITLTQTKSR